jgi:uncharacterized membrane protein
MATIEKSIDVDVEVRTAYDQWTKFAELPKFMEGVQSVRQLDDRRLDPEGMVENLGDALGFVSRRVEGDLQRFKEFIEERGVQTGGWRGEIRRKV